MTDDRTPDTADGPDHGRAIELSVEVPGTPEEVWEAIATGPGITSWYIPMTVEERAGGEVDMDWGAFGHEKAEVVAWDPPRRVVFSGPGDGAMAFEWLVEARDGGSCVVRLVNSGFGDGEEWDEQFHGMSEGWRIFLENLRLQRTFFPGRHATAIVPTVSLPGPHRGGWAAFCSALGVDPGAGVGDRVTTGSGAPPLTGRIESELRSAAATAYLLVLDGPAPGTAFLTVEGDGEKVAASAYLYLYGDDGRPVDPSLGARWTSWMNATFESIAVEANP